MANKGAVLGLVALAFATWAVYLGGISAQQHWACENREAFLGQPLTCSKLYRYDWWLICYELVIIIAAAGVAVSALHRSSNVIMALFAIATVLYTVRTNEQLDALTAQDAADVNGQPRNRQRVVVAGLIMTATINFLVTIAAGISEGVVSHGAHKAADNTANAV